MHTYELLGPRGMRDRFILFVGDNIVITNPGETEPFLTIERLGRAKTRITLRGDEERFTAEDVELLTNTPVPA